MTQPVVLLRRALADAEECAASHAHLLTYYLREEIPAGSTVIARYAVLPHYSETEQGIKILGSNLVNSYREHLYAADLQNWYHDLEDLTPKTWFRPEDVPQNQTGSFVLKGATNSLKFLWDTHMFAQSRAHIGSVLNNILNDSLLSMQPIYVRQYEHLNVLAHAVHGLPITEEYRFFVLNGQVVHGGFYWSNLHESGPTADNVPQSFLRQVIDRVKDNITFFAVDVARTIDNEWRVIELNDGQMSGLNGINAKEFYANLATCALTM